MAALTRKAGRDSRPAARMTLAQLQDALAGPSDLPAARRAAAAGQLLDVARRTLLWERGQALTEAHDDGVEDSELARTLGVPPVEVSRLLADHARAATARQRVSAGQRPVSRSRAAQQLARRLTEQAGVPVEIRWDSSGASSRRPGGWAYHVDWSDGPTVAGMGELVDQLAGDHPGITPADLVYLRTVQPLAIALVLLRNYRPVALTV